MNLSSAMNDTVLADNTGYTKKLRKEIGVDTSSEIIDNSTDDSLSAIVKKVIHYRVSLISFMVM